MTSGTFRQISSSCTLVPYGKLPYFRPSSSVVSAVPTLVPEAGSAENLTSRLFEIFLDFAFDVTLFLRMVAVRRQFGSAPLKPLIVRDAEPLEKANLSSVRISVVPSDLTNVYLSSSNGRKTSRLGESTLIKLVLPVPSIATSNFCLTTILALSRSTDSMFLFGNAL